MNIIISIGFAIVILLSNITFAMILPRVFGILCIIISPYALAESGIIGAIGFLFLGLYNFIILSKKEKKYIFYQNTIFWIMLIIIIFISELF